MYYLVKYCTRINTTLALAQYRVTIKFTLNLREPSHFDHNRGYEVNDMIRIHLHTL